MKMFLGLTVFSFILAFVPMNSWGEINATATGDLDPPSCRLPCPEVVNGDFTIFSGGWAHHTGDIIGNGVDEGTKWTFDFTTDPNYSDPLASAFLTLKLTPRDGLILTDVFGIVGLPSIVTPEIQDLSVLPIGEIHTVHIELLDFYSSDQILGILSSNGGTLPMLYADDSIVSYASLTLLSEADLCPDEYRFGDPAPGYNFSWPYFYSWMEVHFANIGDGDAYNVTATISCVPFNVTVVDGDVALGDIPSGSGAWSTGDTFTLQVDMNNEQPEDHGICWDVEYDDAVGVHHVIEDVAQFCGQECSAICPAWMPNKDNE